MGVVKRLLSQQPRSEVPLRLILCLPRARADSSLNSMATQAEADLWSCKPQLPSLLREPTFSVSVGLARMSVIWFRLPQRESSHSTAAGLPLGLMTTITTVRPH